MFFFVINYYVYFHRGKRFRHNEMETNSSANFNLEQKKNFLLLWITLKMHYAAVGDKRQDRRRNNVDRELSKSSRFCQIKSSFTHYISMYVMTVIIDNNNDNRKQLIQSYIVKFKLHSLLFTIFYYSTQPNGHSSDRLY